MIAALALCAAVAAASIGVAGVCAWRDVVAVPAIKVWIDDVLLWHLAGLRPVRNARYREVAALAAALAESLADATRPDRVTL